MELSTPRHGFTLVEMSIVLVIIGLLVGGVLSGQSLIRAAELRSVVSEYQRYVTAAQSFRDKYQSIPGDFRDATRFWGRQGVSGTAVAGCTTNSSAAVNDNGACDGNGNGILNYPANPSEAGESFQVWRQLALAGLIEGSYSGMASSGQVWATMVGTDAPRSRVQNGGWFAWYWQIAGNASIFSGNYGNALQLGAPVTNGDPSAALFKPEELWNIDTKLDDGLPAQGKVFARHWSTCTNAASADSTSATYLLTSTSVACSVIFKNVF